MGASGDLARSFAGRLGSPADRPGLLSSAGELDVSYAREEPTLPRRGWFATRVAAPAWRAMVATVAPPTKPRSGPRAMPARYERRSPRWATPALGGRRPGPPLAAEWS